MRRVNDTELMQLVQQGTSCVVFVSSGSDRETRLARQLHALQPKLKGVDHLLELRASDVRNAAETRLAFVQFPRVITYKDAGTLEEHVGFDQVTTWIMKL